MGNRQMTVDKFYNKLKEEAKKNNKNIDDRTLWQEAIYRFNDYSKKMDAESGNEIR